MPKMPNTQTVRDALYRLSGALDIASANAAFLKPEKLQLVSAQQCVVWLLARLKQNEAYVDLQTGLGGAAIDTDSAANSLNAVNAVGDGAAAIPLVFAALIQDDDLLPLAAQMYQ